MLERTLWLPLAAAAELGDEPLPVTLLGEELVLWRDGSGAAQVFADRCPHRGARLSLGHVREGRLECGYHGWRFDSTGHCVHVPALPAFAPPEGHRACRHAVQAAHGLLWARLEGDDGTPPGWPGLPSRQVVCGPYDVATSAPRIVENFLDTAHFAFVHPGSLGDPAHAGVPVYDVTLDEQRRPGVDGYRAWQPQASALAAGGAWVRYRYQVLSPYAALLEKQADAGTPREAYALWVCPVGEEHGRVWFTLFTEDASTDAETLRAFQTAIFIEDRPIVESQRPRRLPLQAGAEVHSAADRLSAAYRRYLVELGIGFGVC